jgi:hypothetical protein
MTETVHYPDGSRVMRGYANSGNDGSNPEFAEGWFRKAIQLEVLFISIEAKCCSKRRQHRYVAIALGKL